MVSSYLNRRDFIGAAGLGAAALAGSAAGGPAPDGEASGGAHSRDAGAPWGAVGRAEAHAQIPRAILTPPGAGAWVELDRQAIAGNLEAVRAAAGGLPVMAVVKANAYGHGLVPTARVLADAGADALMVVTVDEALAIRDAGITTPVMNFGPYDPTAAEELVRQRIEQAVYTQEAVEGLAQAALRVGESSPGVHVMMDTGLGRVGVPHERAGEILAAVGHHPELTLAGTLTTLTEEPEYDRVQLERYQRVCEAAGATGIDLGTQHVASSAAVLDFPNSHLDMVRPGIMLYGHYPNERTRQSQPIALQPVLSLKAKVAYVKTLQAGDSVGYLRAYTAQQTETVATLPVGHSEGYPPAAVAGGGHVWIKGRACPLVGGVTSNHVEVRVPAGLEVGIGDIATLIAAEPVGTTSSADGSQAPSADVLKDWTGTSEYGLLMRLNPLLPRLVT